LASLPALLARIALAVRRATDPELIALSFAAAGIVPLDPLAILSELPVDCPDYARVRTAPTKRIDISGKRLTSPEVIAAMGGPAMAEKPDDEDAEEEEVLAPAVAESGCKGQRKLIYVISDTLPDAAETLLHPTTDVPRELSPARQMELATAWKDQHAAARRLAADDTGEEAILVEESEEEARSRGRRKRRQLEEEDEEYDEVELAPKKRKRHIKSRTPGPPPPGRKKN
jgi:hypothetical protein